MSWIASASTSGTTICWIAPRPITLEVTTRGYGKGQRDPNSRRGRRSIMRKALGEVAIADKDIDH